jgi:DNA polymerase zeta
MARNPVYVCGWEFWEGTSAPARVETVRWLNAQDVVGAQASDTSKAKGDKKKKKKKSKTPVRSRISLQHMTMSIMALELCAPAEEEPHPDHHPIAYLSYVFQPLDGLSEDGQLSLQHGYIAVAKNRERLQILGVPAQFVSSEAELIELICQITLRLDPDILLGWEVQRLSWGYLKYRAESFGISCAHKFRPIYN